MVTTGIRKQKQPYYVDAHPGHGSCRHQGFQRSKEMDGGADKADIDGGYAWVILAGCYVMYLIVVGSIKTYGILFTELDEHYNMGSGPVAIIGSLMFFLMFSAGPFANYLAVKTSFRKVAITGSLLLFFGYSVSSFIERLELLFLSLGLSAGLGYGLSFTPCSTIISFYFEKRRALANGITVSASGIGAIAFSVLYKYLIETYSLKPCLLIIGAILLNVCVAACLFRQPESLVRQSKASQKTNGQNKQKLSFKLSLFKNPRFVYYWISFMICVAGYGNNLILIPSQIRALGYDKRSVATAVAITGGSEICARILSGWLADKKWIRPKWIFTICYLVSAVFTFVTPHVHEIYYMYAYAAIIGLFPASFWSLVSVMIIDVVGMKEFSAAYGLVLPGLAIGLCINQFAMGWIKDQTGDWKVSFYATAMMLFIPAILMLLEPMIMPENNRNDLDKIDNVENGPPDIPNKEMEQETDCLLAKGEEEKIKHRPSKIYKAYNNGETKSLHHEMVSAPLATPDSI